MPVEARGQCARRRDREQLSCSAWKRKRPRRNAEVAGISDAVLHEQLHTALDAKQGKESALAERRNVLETAAGELRSLDEQRLKLEQGVVPLRDKINDLRLKAQAVQINEEQFRERLAEVHVVTEADEAPFAEELAAGGRRQAQGQRPAG